MNIDISKLSAKELYELARQKEQEEQRQAELKERLNKLMVQREDMLATYQRTLGKLDEEIMLRQQQRERLITEHELDLSKLIGEIEQTDSEIQHLGSEFNLSSIKQDVTHAAKQGVTHTAPATSAPTPIRNAVPKEPSNEDIYTEIQDLMRNREYISETLLREKLRGMGHANQVVVKITEQLVKDGRLIRKSGGSYILGRR